MKKYQTKRIDKIIDEFLWYETTIKQIESRVGSYDHFDELEEDMSSMKSKISGFKKKLGKAINELKLNLVQLDLENLDSYISYCKIKSTGLRKFPDPETIFYTLYERKVDDLGDYLYTKYYSLDVVDPADFYAVSFFLYSYSMLFKVYAEAFVGICDSNFMKYNWELRHGSPTSIRKETVQDKKHSFGFDKRSGLDLVHVYQYFNAHIDFINTEKTSVEDFVNVLTTSDFSAETRPIYLNCETVQFIYLRSKLSPFFKDLDPTRIEDSKLFFSKKGIVLKKSNLYKNKISNPKKQEEIDRYFNNLQK